jgi:hypothetical protein
MLNVHALWRERLTSQGAAESNDAHRLPHPEQHQHHGSAQQISVLNEPNSWQGGAYQIRV